MDNFNEKVLGLVDERLRALAVACDGNYGAMKRLASLIRSVAEPYSSTEQGYNSYSEIETTGTGSVVPLGDSVPIRRPFISTPPQKEFFWPSLPSLPSMILVSPQSDPNENYVSVQTMYAREYELLEYANAVKKTAMDIVDEVNAGPEVPHSRAWYAKLADDAARHEQLWNKQWEDALAENKKLERELAESKLELEEARKSENYFRHAAVGMVTELEADDKAREAKKQAIEWCIKLLQRIAEDNDDKASRMIGYNVKSRAGNELRDAIAKIRKEEKEMWADE